jgi:hypothetical protein
LSSKIYGATADEWAAFSKLFGDAILPSVCDPTVPVSENSAIQSALKIPSAISRSGHAYGMGAWTTHKATPAQVKAWSEDNRLGICAVTRDINAIDCDCSTPELTAFVVEYFALNIGQEIPLRVGKAGRGTLLVRVDSPEPLAKSKITLRNDGGIVEFLGARQQTMLAGTHSSGVRYWWPGGLPTSVPTISLKEFNELWTALAEHLGSSEQLTLQGVNERNAGTALDSKDPFLPTLTAAGDVLYATKEKVLINCPWASEHSDPTDTEAAYLPATTTQPANYRCLHAHCSDRNIVDLHAHYKYSTPDFDDVPLQPVSWQNDQDWVKVKRKNSDVMAIADDVLNIRVSLKYPELCGGRQFRRDTFRVAPDMKPNKQGQNEWGTVDAESLTLLHNALRDKKIGGYAVTDTEAVVERQLHAYLADKSSDSAVEAMASMPAWDGVSRLNRLAPDILRTKDTEYNRDAGMFLMLSLALRMSTATETEVESAIILVGGQGTGKSRFIRDLCVFNKTISLQLSNDLTKMRRRAIGHAVIHLEELAGLQSTSDDNVKSFVSDSTDAWRRHYAEYDEQVPRRFIIVGSTNKSDVLKDPTGNRRWFPLHVCDGLDPTVQADVISFERDRDQYFAEALHILGTNGQAVVRELSAKHMRSPEAEHARRRIMGASAHHDKIVGLLALSEEKEVTAANVHFELRLKADASMTVLREIERSFVKLGCRCIDSAAMRYENIFYKKILPNLE